MKPIPLPKHELISLLNHAVVDAALGEILVTLSKLEWLINYGEDALKPQRRRGNFVLLHKTSTVYYEPLGVVAAIVSWNYRTWNVLLPVSPSLSLLPFSPTQCAVPNHGFDLRWQRCCLEGKRACCLEFKLVRRFNQSAVCRLTLLRRFVGAVRTCIEACGHDPDIVQVRRVVVRVEPN